MNTHGLTTINIKQLNKSTVYHYIYSKRRTSKQQIAQDLHMGLSTVSQNLAQLEQEGLITRDGYFDSTGGRKAHAIQIVPDYRISIGLSVLNDMIQIAAVDLYGQILYTDTLPLAYTHSSVYYDRVANYVTETITRKGWDNSHILGVSIATQGVTSQDRSAIVFGALMDNTGMQLDSLSSRLPYPCRLEHDSKSAAFLELWNHPDLDSAIIIVLNRNLGGAIIADRQIHEGQSMHGGLLEHMCIQPDGPLCYCNSRGCLETYCSVNALQKAANMAIDDFFMQLRSGNDPRCIEIWDEYLHHLALAMRNLSLIIDAPFVLTGYLAPYFTDRDTAGLASRIQSNSPFRMSADQILISKSGQYTTAIGTSLFYVDQFLKSI